MKNNQKLYLIHGMKRSGNHAIVHWLLPQINCAYFNNFIPVGPILQGHPMPGPIPFHQWQSKQERKTGECPTRLLVTLEDHGLQTLPFSEVDLPYQALLIIRDPRQLFSSRIRKAHRVEMPAYPKANDHVMQRAVDLWKQHARCYLGDQSQLPGRLAILFDTWFSDSEYRRAISDTLRVPFQDHGFNIVGPEGGGSSFDGIGFNGRSQLMSVTDRVSMLEPHERTLLEEIFNDPELSQLCSDVLRSDPYRQMSIEHPRTPGVDMD